MSKGIRLWVRFDRKYDEKCIAWDELEFDEQEWASVTPTEIREAVADMVEDNIEFGFEVWQ